MHLCPCNLCVRKIISYWKVLYNKYETNLYFLCQYINTIYLCKSVMFYFITNSLLIWRFYFRKLTHSKILSFGTEECQQTKEENLSLCLQFNNESTYISGSSLLVAKKFALQDSHLPNPVLSRNEWTAQRIFASFQRTRNVIFYFIIF
jgi:hypothetical protein